MSFVFFGIRVDQYSLHCLFSKPSMITLISKSKENQISNSMEVLHRMSNKHVFNFFYFSKYNDLSLNSKNFSMNAEGHGIMDDQMDNWVLQPFQHHRSYWVRLPMKWNDWNGWSTPLNLDPDSEQTWTWDHIGSQVQHPNQWTMLATPGNDTEIYTIKQKKTSN